MSDNGARALSERLAEVAPPVRVPPRTAAFDPARLAAVILANGAAFLEYGGLVDDLTERLRVANDALPDAAELDRLRAALERVSSMAAEAMGREPVHTLAVLSEISRIARAVLDTEGSARDGG